LPASPRLVAWLLFLPLFVGALAARAYDHVGNRLTRGTQAYAYNANDRLLSDQYDPNGNTRSATLRPHTSGAPVGVNDRYDFENRLIDRNSGQLTVVYDGDGHRVRKTVGGVTTYYLVDDLNPTGYAQVVEELQSSALSPQPSVVRSYTWGHALLAQTLLPSTFNLQLSTSYYGYDGQGSVAWRASFYGYDGHGSVRFLTDENGQVTDSYDYDAFGNLIAQATIFPTPTPNAYRYAGEQFDEDLGLYYNRARYLNTDSGRFWTPDKFEGLQELGDSLNHYTYVRANPVSRTDPSGHFEFTLAGLSITVQHIGHQERQEAEKARRNYNLARRGLCYGGAKGIEHLHHALPWFLGGKDQGSNLIRIPGEEHMRLHQMLHWALKAAMLPGTASDDVYQDLFRGKDGKLERELVHKIVLAVSRDFDKRCKKHLGYAITPKVEEQIRNKQWDF
jgi:RHS repeat-associated protein